MPYTSKTQCSIYLIHDVQSGVHSSLSNVKHTAIQDELKLAQNKGPC